jgi:hypothetical protein
MVVHSEGEVWRNSSPGERYAFMKHWLRLFESRNPEEQMSRDDIWEICNAPQRGGNEAP